MRSIMLGEDDAVAAWAWRTFQLFPMHVNRGIGIVEEDGTIVGAALFQNWNSHNADLSYYGPDTMTPSIVHCLARIACHDLNLQRLTAMTSKRNKHFIGGMIRLGFKVEGVQKRFYGAEDTGRNAAIRLVMFRDELERLAGFNKEKVA